jgi:hypothetical protein
MSKEVADRATPNGTSAARRPAWRRILLIGLSVGALQVAVNQGDVWLRGAVDATLVLKSIMSPLIALAVALVSAVWAQADRGQIVVETSSKRIG